MREASDKIIQLKTFFIHLRLKFNVFLAPIYLYGVVISNGDLFSLTFLREFLILHVFLYGGVNALNDYYDRNEQGPIGGLQNPPPVTGHSLFYFAWLWKLIGLYLSVRYSSSTNFVLGVILCIFMSVAYSHPKIRLKSKPLWSTLIVILLQGFLIYYFGSVVSVCDEYHLLPLRFWLGGFVVTLLTLGSYLLSQVYQIEQDIRQGDRTLAVALGVERTFQFSSICSLVSGIMNSFLVGYYYHWWESLITLLNILLYIYGVQHWKQKFTRQTVIENFQSLHRLLTVQSVCLYTFCLAHLLNIL